MRAPLTWKPRDRQRGSVAVEFGLVMPIIFLLIIGAIGLGLPLGTRLRLADATRRVARDAAAEQTSDEATLTSWLQTRMAGSHCDVVTVEAEVEQDVRLPGAPTLRVTGRCLLRPLFAKTLGLIVPDRLAVTERVPFLRPPNP